MNEVWQFIKDLVNPESIAHLGLPFLLFIIFAETGLFFGFFLPGDNLVLISGFICATMPEVLGVNIFVLILLMSLAAIAGNIAGYYFGKRVGDTLYKRPDSLFFKRRHIKATQRFYKKYGGIALFFGRFWPVIRTFAPILAGVIKIDLRKFMLYNIAGAFSWISLFCGIGYFLGVKFPGIRGQMGYIFAALIILTAIPVVITYWKGRRTNSRASDDGIK